MAVDYIIIQAGGKGSRLKHLTRNKPKGITPVNNLPIIFHMFHQYADKRFVIIGDYKHEVLEKYLDIFAKVKYITVKAEGHGTCAGINKALEYIPEGAPFMLIWSDLILAPGFDLDALSGGNYVGLSKDFECRWSYQNGHFIEEPSQEQGIAGMFVFRNKEELSGIPQEGEFVRWLGSSSMKMTEVSLKGTCEIGTLLAYSNQQMNEYRCRPFNSMEVKGDILIKRPIDDQGRKLAVREVNWYREIQKYGFTQIPKLYSLEPLTMQKIDGTNIFKTDFSVEQKKIVIDNLVTSLEALHKLKTVPADTFSVMEAYYHKTFDRLESVRDLIPFSDKEFIRINGRNCRNPYFYRDELRNRIKQNLCDCQEFVLIHGDCTFSNTMVDSKLNVIFLDPRGYFGFSELYGDANYDWAKLYYSIAGDYDQFNNKKFSLFINEKEVVLDIDSNGWKDMSEYFLNRITNCKPDKIKLLHAIIWLSLTTYAWEDYDSICGAFYNGTYLLEEVL